MKPNFLLALIVLVVLITTIGCGTAPRPTAVPTLAPQIITVVITATPPAAADTPAPTIATTTTLTTTAAITGTTTVIAQAKATNTTAPVRTGATATRRPNTATPAKAGTAAPTGIPSIAKYPQAVLRLMSPIYSGNDPGDQRDVRQFGADALVFEWQSIGALGTNECYLIRVDTKSQADQSVGGDTFLYCDPGTKATQALTAQTAQFTLNKPLTTPGPTYSGITPPGGGDVTVTWSVTIARDDGPGAKGDAYYWLDGSRHKYTLLSPRSNVVSFILKGAPTP